MKLNSSFISHPARDNIREMSKESVILLKLNLRFRFVSLSLSSSDCHGMKILFCLETLRDMCKPPQEHTRITTTKQRKIWILFRRNEKERWIYYECDLAFHWMNISEWINKSFLHLLCSHDINSRFIVHVVSHLRFSRLGFAFWEIIYRRDLPKEVTNRYECTQSFFFKYAWLNRIYCELNQQEKGKALLGTNKISLVYHL